MSHTAELIAVGTEILLGNIANTDNGGECRRKCEASAKYFRRANSFRPRIFIQIGVPARSAIAWGVGDVA